MSDRPITEQTSAVPNDCQLAMLLHQEDWIRELASKQKLREALVLHSWSLSAHFRVLSHRFKLDNFEDGETPDFVLIGAGTAAQLSVGWTAPSKAPGILAVAGEGGVATAAGRGAIWFSCSANGT